MLTSLVPRWARRHEAGATAPIRRGSEALDFECAESASITSARRARREAEIAAANARLVARQASNQQQQQQQQQHQQHQAQQAPHHQQQQHQQQPLSASPPAPTRSSLSRCDSRASDFTAFSEVPSWKFQAAPKVHAVLPSAVGAAHDARPISTSSAASGLSSGSYVTSQSMGSGMSHLDSYRQRFSRVPSGAAAAAGAGIQWADQPSRPVSDASMSNRSSAGRSGYASSSYSSPPSSFEFDEPPSPIELSKPVLRSRPSHGAQVPPPLPEDAQSKRASYTAGPTPPLHRAHSHTRSTVSLPSPRHPRDKSRSGSPVEAPPLSSVQAAADAMAALQHATEVAASSRRAPKPPTPAPILRPSPALAVADTMNRTPSASSSTSSVDPWVYDNRSTALSSLTRSNDASPAPSTASSLDPWIQPVRTQPLPLLDPFAVSTVGGRAARPQSGIYQGFTSASGVYERRPSTVYDTLSAANGGAQPNDGRSKFVRGQYTQPTILRRRPAAEEAARRDSVSRKPLTRTKSAVEATTIAASPPPTPKSASRATFSRMNTAPAFPAAAAVAAQFDDAPPSPMTTTKALPRPGPTPPLTLKQRRKSIGALDMPPQMPPPNHPPPSIHFPGEQDYSFAPSSASASGHSHASSTPRATPQPHASPRPQLHHQSYSSSPQPQQHAFAPVQQRFDGYSPQPSFAASRQRVQSNPTTPTALRRVAPPAFGCAF